MSSADPSSPEATHTVTPSSAAAFNVSLTALIAAGVHVYCPSAYPQLMESTVGLCTVSCTAVVSASTHPCCVKVEK